MKNNVRISIFLFIPILLLLAACGSPKSSGVDPTALPYTPQAVQGGTGSEPVVGRPEQGQVVFEERCSRCHAIQEGINVTSPSLYAAGTRLDYDYVAESIVSPGEHIAAFDQGQDSIDATTMPTDFKQALTTQEFEDLVAYILSLK